MRYETDRLILRSWQDSDIQPFANMCADKNVMRFFPKVLTFDETVALVDRIRAKFVNDGFCFFAVELKSTGEFIGFIGLSIPSFVAHFTPCVEIGWRLASSYQGLGYATEGALKCLEIGFSELQLNEIVSIAVLDNINSHNVMHKIGMARDINGNFLHPHLPPDHKFAEHVLYRISKQNYYERLQHGR